MDRRQKTECNKRKDKQIYPQYYGSVESQGKPSNVGPAAGWRPGMQAPPPGRVGAIRPINSVDDIPDPEFTEKEVAWFRTIVKNIEQQESGHNSYSGGKEKKDFIDEQILGIAREYLADSYLVDSPPADD